MTPNADYVWGSSVSLSELQPGDVIQMRDYRFDREVVVNNPDGSGSTDSDFQERPHHTVIVESVDGNGAVTVLEQNAPTGSAVRRSAIVLHQDSDDDGGAPQNNDSSAGHVLVLSTAGDSVNADCSTDEC